MVLGLGEEITRRIRSREILEIFGASEDVPKIYYEISREVKSQ